VVGLEDGLGGGDSGAHGLGPTTEAGKEVRLDEPGDDAHVGLDVLALQKDGRAVDPPDLEVVPAVGVVVDDGVAAHDRRAHQFLHFARGRLAMGTGGTEQRDGVVGDPAALEQPE
jgi:hypothetical protein